MSEETRIHSLGQSVQQIRASISEILQNNGTADLDDNALVNLTRIVESLGSVVDAARCATASELKARCQATNPDGRLDLRLGARSPHDLLTRLTGASSASISRRFKAGSDMFAPKSLSGEPLPGTCPLVRAAREAGVIGQDTADAILTSMTPLARGHVLADVAERAILASALGITPPSADEVPDLSVEELHNLADHDPLLERQILPADTVRQVAALWAQALDPDGTLPKEVDAKSKRTFTLTPTKDGLVKVNGYLLPEVGAQLRTLLDAVTNPRVSDTAFLDSSSSIGGDIESSEGLMEFTGSDSTVVHSTEAEADSGSNSDENRHASSDDSSGMTDSSTPLDVSGLDVSGTDQHPNARRSGPQILHDAFASLLFKAAALPSMPLLGGAPPTLVVTMNEEDLANPRGTATLNNAPAGKWQHAAATIPSNVALSLSCDAVIERVHSNSTGKILSLDTSARVFTPQQRRAIAARDGGCIIPGCTVGPTWCEVHHVHEHAAGGPTHTDNGVLLCWYHHRFLDTLTWQIRMNDGVPEVKAPPFLGKTNKWIPAQSSRTRELSRARRLLASHEKALLQERAELKTKAITKTAKLQTEVAGSQKKSRSQSISPPHLDASPESPSTFRAELRPTPRPEGAKGGMTYPRAKGGIATADGFIARRAHPSEETHLLELPSTTMPEWARHLSRRELASLPRRGPFEVICPKAV